MERIRKSLLIIIFMLLMGVTFNVKAVNFKYYLSNSDQNYEYVDKNNSKAIDVKRGDTFTVVAILEYNTDNVEYYTIDSGKLTIRWDDKYLSLQEVDGKYYNDSITDISGLTIGSISKGSNKLTIDEISSKGMMKNGKNKIAEFKFSVLNDAPSGEAKVYQMDGEDTLKCMNRTTGVTTKCGVSLYSELKYNIPKSTINKLSSIKINGQELEYFNEDTNDYDIQVESNVEKVNIDVTIKDSRSTVTGNSGENIIKYGENKLTITVTSESGAKNIYNITINRIDARSSVNTLKTLTLSSGEITFKPEITDYIVNVDNTVEKLTISAKLTDPKAKYAEDYNNKEIELLEGSNKVEIKVIAENGDEKVYTLNINRALSSNNSLKSLKINDEKIELKENEFIYNLVFENEVEEIVIKAEPNDVKATLDLQDKYPLQVGDNEINITVTAASGAKASYILNITRKKLLSKDSLLTSIKIKGYTIPFKPSTTSYDLKIDEKDEQLEITATQEDPNATIEIEGNKDLINGSVIKINVKAEDGSFTRYFINIEKGSSGISPVIIIIIVLLLLLGLCIGLIIYRKKKKEKAQFDKLDNDKEVKVNEVQEETSLEEEKNDLLETSTSEENLDEVNNEMPVDVVNDEEIPNLGSRLQDEENINMEHNDEQNKDVEL